MHIKATIVAYAFLVQCFENANIVAYAGLRVKTKYDYDSLVSCKCNQTGNLIIQCYKALEGTKKTYK